jgi:hypothetical protein
MHRVAWSSPSGYWTPRRLDFQITLFQANIHIPIIFMTGHGVTDDCKGLKTGSGVDAPTA